MDDKQLLLSVMRLLYKMKREVDSTIEQVNERLKEYEAREVLKDKF